MSVFARSFNVLEAGGCCTDSTVHGKHRDVVSRGCLRFLFRPAIATVRQSIFTAIFPHGYPGCRCYVSATVERCNYYGWGG